MSSMSLQSSVELYHTHAVILVQEPVMLLFPLLSHGDGGLGFAMPCPPVVGELPHEYQLVRLVVKRFVMMRLKHHAKLVNRVTLQCDGRDRSRFSRLIIHLHQ